jgi:hypothetical protein
MASGLPVVTLDEPMNAAKFLVEKGKNGFVVTEKRLPGALTSLLSNRVSLRWVGWLSREISGERDWDSVVKLFLHVYV